MADFEVYESYLHSLVTTYEQWWNLYALTDAVGRGREPEQGQAISSPSPSPSPFDFGLMVQTVSSERDRPNSEADSLPPQENREKIERLPVLEGIRKYADEHVLLVGRPGSGKSTALIRLLLEMATQALEQGTGQIPILIELRYWQDSVIERIRSFLHKHDPELDLDDETLRSLLRQGCFLLLIDGLNELPSEAARTQLSSFRQDYAKVPMIFTTRDLSLGGDLGIEKKLEMQPLTEGQMKEFVRAYVPDQAEVLLRQLNARLREFGQTPLLLWMLCEVFQQSPGNQMPSNLAGIFQAFTTMYEDSSVRKHEVAPLKGDVRPLSDRRLWKEALQTLASVMMQGETPVDFRVAIDRNEAERELKRIFADERFPIRDILDDLLKYHLLQNRGDERGQIEFRHQLIQEYYAAEWLLGRLDELNDEELKRDYLNLLKWTEPIALMLGLVSDEEQALWVVKLALDDVDLMLGARLAGEIRLTWQDKPIRWVVQLAIPLELKIQLLGKSRSSSAIAILIDLSFHPSSFSAEPSVEHFNSWNISSKAIETLKKIGSEAVVASLVQVLSDTDCHVSKKSSWGCSHQFSRERAAQALGEIGSEVAVTPLIQALDDSNSSLRKIIAQALGEIGSEAAVTPLIQALGDSSSSVREKAAQALGKIGSEAAVTPLVKAFKNSNDSTFHVSASGALNNILGRAAISILPEIPKHIPLFFMDSEEIKKAQEGLAETFFKSQVLSLIRALGDSYSCNPDSTTETLEVIAKKVGVAPLVKVLEDSDYEASMAATEALLRIFPSKASAAAILRALNHSHPFVRHNAAQALGEIGSEIAVDGLMQALEDDKPISEEAAKSLGKICSSQFLASLWKLSYQKPDKNLVEAIATIQNRCKFYNHEIFHNLDLDLIPQGKTISLYFSYAPADETLQTQLANHLTLLERQGVITSWDKRQILPGDEPSQGIAQQLNTADIILLLISANSLADDTCYDLEIQRAIERHQADEARVIPILLRPVDWTGLPLSQLEVLPKGQRAITSWENQDEAFEEIARGIREVAMELRRG